MPETLAWIDDESESWCERGLNRHLKALRGSTPGRVVRDGRTLVNFASNDYLGLASDPRVIATAVEASNVHGWGSGASPLVSGWFEPHEALAQALAKFEGVEAVALFPSGFAANLGTISALVGPGDAVYLDRLNHACLIDGARLSRAKLRVYPHNDSNRLEAILSRDRGKFRRSLIATDGIFSMDGDVAPLGDLADLASRFDAMLLVDEAHGTGVFGANGRGAAEHCGVHDRVDVLVGTLSKALGSVGGFVAGSRRLVDWLINQARPLIYSTSLPAPAAAAANRALEILEAEPWRRSRLFELSRLLREGLLPQGSLDLGNRPAETAGATHSPPTPTLPHKGGGGQTQANFPVFSGSLFPGGEGRLAHPQEANSADIGPIVPVILKEPGFAVEMAAKLVDRGFLVPAIRPPTVPEGTARLRISLSAAHESADVDRLLLALGEA